MKNGGRKEEIESNARVKRKRRSCVNLYLMCGFNFSSHDNQGNSSKDNHSNNRNYCRSLFQPYIPLYQPLFLQCLSLDMADAIREERSRKGRESEFCFHSASKFMASV